MAGETLVKRGASLELKAIGEISGSFFVPAYQRGYRWGEHEVRALLDDVWGNGDKPYCLQPVVVKQGVDEWELVDGQQRLTTLYLVFLYLLRGAGVGGGPGYSLRFETRERSAKYLSDLSAAEAGENIDFFHIHGAYEVIGKWFGAHPGAAEAMHDRLREKVQVIWYEAPGDVSGTTLFTRLNVGRIPLTNAELIKALLLRQDDVTPAEQAIEIAAQWDIIERDLRDPERWAFLTNAREDEHPTRIGLLFDLLARRPEGRKAPRFHTFETVRGEIEQDGRKRFWERVLDLHARILEWNEDRDLHHKVGYLIAEGEDLLALVDSADQCGRREFQKKLDESIRKRLKLTSSAIDDLTYDKNSDDCRRLLTWMNVESVRLLKNSDEHYSFHAHKQTRWSLEHIHAQHAEGLKTVAQWKAWMNAHLVALTAHYDVVPATRTALLERINAFIASPKGDAFALLSQEVLAALASTGDAKPDALHSISNLALLASDDNSALSNAAFEVKRRQILDRDRDGSFIPLCTRRVFLKYFPGADAKQIHFWSTADRTAYLTAIRAVVGPYLTPESTP